MEEGITSQENGLQKSRSPVPGIIVIAAVVSLIALAVWMIVSLFTSGAAARQQAAVQDAFEEASGIRIVRVVSSAQGGMIDLQYQIVDPDKALIVHDDETPPILVNEKTGVALERTLHEHGFRELHTGIIYRYIIVNEGNAMQRGDKVTLKIGDIHLTGLVIQ